MKKIDFGRACAFLGLIQVMAGETEIAKEIKGLLADRKKNRKKIINLYLEFKA